MPRLSFLSFSSLISSLEHVLPVGDQGKNVNGWHWNEKDSFPWFKHQFTEHFDDTVLFEGATNGPAGIIFVCIYLHEYMNTTETCCATSGPAGTYVFA